MNNQMQFLPFERELESPLILRKLTSAHRALAELKGVAATIPNETILINTLSLQEAKDSSAIENIITTNDELFRSDMTRSLFVSHAAKEVHRYAQALRYGFEQVKSQGLLTSQHILEIQATIEENRAGIRRLPGTTLQNENTGEVVYTPPQHPDEIIALMNNLEQFINDDQLSDWDSLIKMAVIHHQFESIHPFYDGNGRTGRIINILYLVKQGLLKIPVLYLSRYINQNKTNYYRLLQHVRTANDWEEWLLYMLEGVEQTSLQTIKLIEQIRTLMQTIKQRMRTELPRIYSQELLNNLFRHPYSKIEFVMDDLQVTRKTAAKYLNRLAESEILSRHKIGKENYYLNDGLVSILFNVGAQQKENT